MHRMYIFFILVSLISCNSKLRYIGQQYSAVKNVEVFVSANSIKSPYIIIGKGYMSRVGFSNPEKIQQKAISKGHTVGADAVLITDYYIPDTDGSVINTIFKSDSVGKGIITTGNTIITPTSSGG